MMDGNLFLSPREVLERVSQALPATVRERVIVVGSLAAGFRFFDDQGGAGVRTKDADCLLSPRLEALGAGMALAAELLDAGWTYHPVDEFRNPGTSATPQIGCPSSAWIRRISPDGSSRYSGRTGRTIRVSVHSIASRLRRDTPRWRASAT